MVHLDIIAVYTHSPLSLIKRYNGRPTEPPAQFPAEMEKACQFVEKVVNDEMSKRPHFKLEWGGRSDGDLIWRANVAASNSYRGGKESVGFHSDQLTYLGPYPTIASLSLGRDSCSFYFLLCHSLIVITGTRRNFCLREVIPIDQAGVRKAQTFNVPLPHNSVSVHFGLNFRRLTSSTFLRSSLLCTRHVRSDSNIRYHLRMRWTSLDLHFLRHQVIPLSHQIAESILHFGFIALISDLQLSLDVNATYPVFCGLT